MENEQRELEEIEYRNRTWKNEFLREHSIWEQIAMQINSNEHTDEERAYWGRVMDLYHKKYRGNDIDLKKSEGDIG
jgi:hypothetical protein